MNDDISTGKNGLPPEAYEQIAGDDYPPYVPADQDMREFTLRAVLVGSLLGILFGAANAYLGLKVGLTVSASIPAAVMSVAIFRILGRASILENNSVQTIGSAGESLAAGVIFTLPALILLGFNPSVLKIFVLSLIGGWLGVLFMVPLRSYLISKEHGKLPYPEGTACAEVLVAGDEGGSRAKTVFYGLGLGAAYEFMMSGMGLWKDKPLWNIPGYEGGQLSGDVSPALLGVGYVIGPKIAAIMFGGGALAWLVFIPAIVLFGKHADVPVFPADTLIAKMSVGEIWHNYIRYIGAGAVAFGGLITLVRAIPTIVQSFQEGLKGLKLSGQKEQLRTKRDLPMSYVLGGVAILAFMLWVLPDSIIEVNLLTAILMVVFAFFFVTVSSRIVGLIGSSSNPVSGMTIATLLLTSLIFVGLGWTGREYQAVALSVGAVVCIAAALAGDTSQDLKTGFLVGATPKHQQLGELVGVLTSALVVGWIVLRLHKGIGIGSADLPAPQATLMSLVVKGVLSNELPWGLVLIGIFLAAIVELLGIASLPFAVGVYLPLSLTTPILIGGGIRYLTEKKSNATEIKERRERGVLYASGLIAGAAFIGMGMGLFRSFDLTRSLVDNIHLPSRIASLKPLLESDALALMVFAALVYTLWRVVSRSRSDI